MYLLSGSALVAAMWGLTPFYSKHITSLGHSPETILFVSSIVFFIVMLLIMLFKHNPLALWKETQSFLKKVKLPTFVLWVVILYVLSIIVYYKVLAKHPTFLVIALTSIYPLITLVASYFLFKEHPKPLQFVAIILVTIGIILLQL
jgi:uncharacterized membrane protein